LAEHLLACGDQVLGCSGRGAWPGLTPAALVREADVISWNIGDPQGLSRTSRERIAAFAPDRIYHLAAISVPDLCGEREPTPEAIAVNVDGTRRVLELAMSLQPSPRVVCISSSHVYAPVSLEQFVVSEDSPLGPTRGYGVTKLSAEEQARRAADQGLHVVIARAFQHTGARQGPQMMLPEWISQFAADDAAPIRVRTLDAYIDLTDVRDMVQAYRRLAEVGESGEVYNVGSGICRRSGDILELLRGRFGGARTIVETRSGRKQDPIAATGKMFRQADWRAKIGLEQTIADAVEFWLRRDQPAVEREIST
jgi:GDP-4-dehydro-6-deoxy-D-mannose reductase